MKTFSRTIWGSVLATSSMTLFMMWNHRRLPEKERSPLPPATITDDLLPTPTTSEASQNTSLASHFAYGVVLASAFTYFAHKSRGPYSLSRGAAYGSAVWAANYLGLLPALGVRSQALAMPARRNGMMLVAHLVWGITLAFAEEVLRREGDTIFDGSQKRAAAE